MKTYYHIHLLRDQVASINIS